MDTNTKTVNEEKSGVGVYKELVIDNAFSESLGRLWNGEIKFVDITKFSVNVNVIQGRSDV